MNGQKERRAIRPSLLMLLRGSQPASCNGNRLRPTNSISVFSSGVNRQKWSGRDLNPHWQGLNLLCSHYTTAPLPQDNTLSPVEQKESER